MRVAGVVTDFASGALPALFLALSASLPAAGSGAETTLFDEVTGTSGLAFAHFNGMSGEFYFPEMTGQGGALLDFDNDGDLDVYLVQGAMLGPGKTLKDALLPPADVPLTDRLFRNDLVIHADGSRTLRFTDVTAASGIDIHDYGMGVAAGDFDNDGHVDLYVTGYGANHLLRNLGDGRFADVTDRAGVQDARWSTSAAFFDYDGDGRLDLYVVNYVDFPLDRNPACYAPSSRRDYCGPAAFQPVPDRLFRNLGDGRFADMTPQALPGYRPGPGLGVVTADLNGDGRPDVYVANDGQPNQLWLNQGDGRFREDGLFSGVAVNREGRAEASMGVDAGDFDNDGDLDLFMTHLMGETNTLYVNGGKGLFEDRTQALGLGSASFARTAFGTAWFDYDNDGWLDLLTLNGAVQVIEHQAAAGDPYPLHQPNQLYRNLGGKGFAEVTDRAGPALALSEVSRGAAFGDIDNDGDMDVLVTNNNGPVRLLLNRHDRPDDWVGLRLLEGDPGRDALGARVTVTLQNGVTLTRRARTDGSYCVANDPRVLIGVGADAAIASAHITWPDGSRQTIMPVIGRYLTVRRNNENKTP